MAGVGTDCFTCGGVGGGTLNSQGQYDAIFVTGRLDLGVLEGVIAEIDKQTRNLGLEASLFGTCIIMTCIDNEMMWRVTVSLDKASI